MDNISFFRADIFISNNNLYKWYYEKLSNEYLLNKKNSIICTIALNFYQKELLLRNKKTDEDLKKNIDKFVKYLKNLDKKRYLNKKNEKKKISKKDLLYYYQLYKNTPNIVEYINNYIILDKRAITLQNIFMKSYDINKHHINDYEIKEINKIKNQKKKIIKKINNILRKNIKLKEAFNYLSLINTKKYETNYIQHIKLIKKNINYIRNLSVSFNNILKNN